MGSICGSGSSPLTAAGGCSRPTNVSFPADRALRLAEALASLASGREITAVALPVTVSLSFTLRSYSIPCAKETRHNRDLPEPSCIPAPGGQNALSRHRDFAFEVVFFAAWLTVAQLERTGNDECPFPVSIAWAGLVSHGMLSSPGSSADPSRLAKGSRPPTQALQGAQHLEEGGNAQGLAFICNS